MNKIECALCEHSIARNKGKVRWLFGNPKKTERKAEGGAAGSAAHHRAGAAAILYDCADFSEYFAVFSDRRDIADRRNRVFQDRKSTRLNSSHPSSSRMPSSA